MQLEKFVVLFFSGGFEFFKTELKKSEVDCWRCPTKKKLSFSKLQVLVLYVPYLLRYAGFVQN
jgi:hypothetical protein